MNNRKGIGLMLQTCQENIEDVTCRLDELDFASPEWHLMHNQEVTFRGIREGIKLAALALDLISEDEFRMCISDLIEELSK